jgi:hypothetical protein
MKRVKQAHIILAFTVIVASLGFYTCGSMEKHEEELIEKLKQKGLVVEKISAEDFYKGNAPANFEAIAGAPYKPSFNEEPEIPAQCWIETSYGTQNACKYCHTDYLAEIKHGNNFPISDDQETFSFPSANLNRILWQNIIYPHKIEERLANEGIATSNLHDVAYVRDDNWQKAYNAARGNGNTSWINTNTKSESLVLFPALNPNHLFPCNPKNPTNYGANGYVDKYGFVKDEADKYTGWRAINFFPYAIFTPLKGSVSGIYIRLSKEFMSSKGIFNVEVYKQNLSLLEKNIKNQQCEKKFYVGDASNIAIHKGFYPVGTEFAHPLHYVDLLADGQVGKDVDGVMGDGTQVQFEFPGTRSKRVKEIRYMYKWREVGLEDIGEDEEDEEGEGDDEEFGEYIGKEGHGWIDNEAGWILAAYIENRKGELRPQTTEELAQCMGCHSKVGNTIDAVWSFQRKLPDHEGWAEMSYGHYNSQYPDQTKLQDYMYRQTGMGEQGYFYYSVVGADLYGVMPKEVRDGLINYAAKINLEADLGISFTADEILNDHILKELEKAERQPRLEARQKLMRHYSKNLEYLAYSEADDKYYIKGSIFYPTHETMKANIQGYRKIVLDQSYNLGKDVFGNQADHIPFTFRSDGTVLDEKNQVIPVGEVIYSRPFNEDGEGITPTGIVEGDAFDANGKLVREVTEKDRIAGHLIYSGTLDKYYNPILSGIPIRK